MPKPEEIYQRLRDKKVPLAIASSVLAVVLITAISLALLLPGDAGGGSTTSPGKQQEGDETTTSPSNPREKLGGGATVSPDVEVQYTGVKAQASLDLYKQWYKGDGTYYGSEGEGTCQVSKSNLPTAARNSKYLVALNKPQFMGSASCGMCFTVKGSGQGRGTDPITGEFIVFVKDLCPPCTAGDVDLAVDGDGRWDIEIRGVQCPVGNTAIQYWFQGSNEWYLKLQIRNARVPAHKVEVKTLLGSWRQLQLTSDGHWEGGRLHVDGNGDIPVRLTSITGAVVEDVIPRLENDVVMDGTRGVQFPVDATLPNV